MGVGRVNGLMEINRNEIGVWLNKYNIARVGKCHVDCRNYY